jgi:ParB-like nuclease domain.
MSSDKTKSLISSMLNQESLQAVIQVRKKIPYGKILPNENNHYSMDNLEELADSIEDLGLLQDLLVKEIDDNNYVVIAGHRRLSAIRILVEERNIKKFEQVSCVICDKDEDEVISQIKLHVTNTTTRELSEYDKMIAISELERLINEASDKGIKIKGKKRKLIAEQMNLGETQVQKYLSVNEHATQEIRQNLKSGDITLTDAYDTTIKNKKEKSIIKLEKTELEYKTNKNVVVKFRSFQRAVNDIEFQDEELNLLISQIAIKLENIILKKGVTE